MRKHFMIALMALACGAMMAACGGKSQNEPVLADTTIQEEPMADTVKYLGNGFEADSQAEYVVAGDQLVCVVEGEKVYENLNAEVFYGDTMPEALKELEEGAVLLSGSVIDRMNHGEKNNCWIKVVK